MTTVAEGPAVGSRRRPDAAASPAAFVALAFGLSWTAWGTALVAEGPIVDVAQVAGSFGPSLAAVALLARAGGWSAVRNGLARLVRLGRAAGPTAAAALVPVAVAGGAVLVDRALGGATAIEWPPWWAVPIVVGYVLVLGGPLGEELGWRGHLLPTLESRWGPTPATLVVGVVWAVWHLPLFLLPGTVQAALPPGLFAVQIIATSFVYTWLVHLTPHSLAPVLAFHTSFNVTVGLVLLQPADDPAARPLLIALAMVAALAAVLARTTTFRGVTATPLPLDDRGAAHVDHDVPTS